MSKWTDAELWAMAEQLSGIMDALRSGERPRAQFKSQAELPLGHGGNVIPFPRRNIRYETARADSCDRSGTS